MFRSPYRSGISILLGIFAVLALFVVSAPRAYAHPFLYGVVHTDLSATGNTLTLRTDTPSGISAAASLEDSPLAKFSTYFAENLKITERGAPCTLTLTQFGNTSSSTRTRFDGVITCPGPITSLSDISLHSSLFTDYYQNFDHFITLSIGTGEWMFAFSPQNQDYPGTVEAVDVNGQSSSSTTDTLQATPQSSYHSLRQFFESLLSVAAQFIWLGATHIWTGYDHILFIISIILLMRSWRRILILITSFTIAHSITLMLAGLKIITLSPRIVEPLIALTIAYVALCNLWSLLHKRAETHLHERWMTTFGFGLIHGLGFAGALVESGIPQTFFIPALVIFNVGIELGQMTILVIAIPALFLIDRSPFRTEILLACTALIACVALFWFIVRLAL